MANVYQVTQVLQTLYPLQYAEEWDHPGLIVGDLDHEVNSIVFAADPTMAVVDDAIASGADMLVTHHPLFFRSVHEVSGLGFRGQIVSKLYRAGCALWVGHTNADAAYRGVAQAAADFFGLENQVPLQPVTDPQSTHAVGIGRVGMLSEPLSLQDFAMRVAGVLPRTNYGVQVAGPLDQMIQKVAVLPGSGDSMFREAGQSGADVYVTSDLRHHPATDEMQQNMYLAGLHAEGIVPGEPIVRPCLINTPHSAIESLWFNYALEDVPVAVEQATGTRPQVRWNRTNTDPWGMSIPANALV